MLGKKQPLNKSATMCLADNSGQIFFCESQFKNLRTISIFLLPFVAFLAFRAPDILFFLSEEALEILTLPFQIIVWAIIFVYYDISLLEIAWVLNKKRIIFSTVLIGTMSYLSLIFYLAPRYGLEGLCTTILISLIIMFIFTSLYLQKAGVKIPLYKSCEKPVVATMGLAVVLHYVNSFPFIFILLAGFISYSLILITTLALDK